MPDVWSYEGYFFDLDGTILLGDQLLPGVSDSLQFLRESGKKVLFLSNTTVRTRRDCQVRLQELGLQASLDEIVTAGFASAIYLRESKTSPVVLVIGESALTRELEEQGVRYTMDPHKATHVLVGMDTHFDYTKLHHAMTAVRNGAILIAANPDPNCPVSGDLLPDTWSLVKAIETASSVEPHVVIGKPSEFYSAKVLEWCGLPGDRCLMIGDRLETDILLGIMSGFRTALVLTGVASREDIERLKLRPDYVWNTMEDFLAFVRA
ncbi:HAD-IIA family hydrolase [Paenibacillus puldeungensis]|uniref:Acid sugar phosphatase n=1 Tax=Paenibacillus puldeungensis TaxID=696536 RepID=A0ABW3RUZ3_9BACL